MIFSALCNCIYYILFGSIDDAQLEEIGYLCVYVCFALRNDVVAVVVDVIFCLLFFHSYSTLSIRACLVLTIIVVFIQIYCFALRLAVTLRFNSLCSHSTY